MSDRTLPNRPDVPGYIFFLTGIGASTVSKAGFTGSILCTSHEKTSIAYHISRLESFLAEP